MDPDKPVDMPLSYALDKLAQRWNTDPERLEELRDDTLLRGLEFMRLESLVTHKKGIHD